MLEPDVALRRRRRGIEAPHRELATRQRAPLVAVELDQAFGEVVPVAPLRIEALFGLAHPHHLDMRGRDPVGALAALVARAFAGNRARERRDRTHQLQIEPRGTRKTMAKRIACRARLAGRGARTGALARIAPVSAPLACAGLACIGLACIGRALDRHATAGGAVASVPASLRTSLAASLARRPSSSRSMPSRRSSAAVIIFSMRSTSSRRSDTVSAVTLSMVRPAAARAALTVCTAAVSPASQRLAMKE